ncbi:hypothetical protein [Clostridium lundense]|uniref:hypothetical protein n=1 Tax=Clostridium lundense TaxID=319475 RepID=UPI0004882BE3|nr:hypothetical protein [Clostridium lundense]
MTFKWRKSEEDFDEIGVNYIEVREEQEEKNINPIFKGKGIREKEIIDKREHIREHTKNTNKQKNVGISGILKTIIKVIIGSIIYLVVFAEFTKVTGVLTLIGGPVTIYYLYYENKKFKAKNILVKILVGILLSIFIFIFGLGGIISGSYYEDDENPQLENIQREGDRNRKNEIYTKIEKEKLYISTIICNNEIV